MENKLSGVLAATLALTMSLPTGAIASSAVRLRLYLAKKLLAKIWRRLLQRMLHCSRSPMRRLALQYALIDNGKLILSGQTGKNDIEGKNH